MKITVDSHKSYGKFEGFGASGAWWAQEVGGWTHIDEKSGIPVRDEISRLLYNKEYSHEQNAESLDISTFFGHGKPDLSLQNIESNRQI